MTRPSTSSERDEPNHDADHVLYRWTCPLCGETRVVLTARRSEVLRTLRSHVHSSSDPVHGGPHSYPAPLADESLIEYVTRMD